MVEPGDLASSGKRVTSVPVNPYTPFVDVNERRGRALWPSVVLTWCAEDRRPSPHGGGSLAASKVNTATGIPFIRALSTVSWVPELALT
jgi:hypothetical protein